MHVPARLRMRSCLQASSDLKLSMRLLLRSKTSRLVRDCDAHVMYVQGHDPTNSLVC
jgi:hypothetical protein